jgi:pyroglutamyl-peptidase
MRILITGFEPFGQHQINASWEAVRDFQWTSTGDLLRLEEIPVDYQRVDTLWPHLLADFKPDIALLLGVMAEVGFLRLESRAQNIIGPSLDNSSWKPETETIRHDGPVFLSTELPWASIYEELNSMQLPAKISDDAGAYLCNYSYYLALDWAEKTGAMVAFLHVPVLGEPFSVEQLQSAIRVCLDHARRELKKRPHKFQQ